MNLQNTGAFLKRLRKEKGLTQEQLAEQFFVSSRSVSRWETGSNMPDLDTLIALADFYDVDIREIIDGRRKNETMNDDTKDTLMKVAEYAETEKQKLKSRMLALTVGTLIFLLLFCISDGTDILSFLPHDAVSGFSLGVAVAGLILNVLYLCGALEKARVCKLKLFHRIFRRNTL